MVRATVAFVVVALGAAAVIAQASEASSQLDTREPNNDLEVREYVVDDVEARGHLEDIVDIDAREPEVFDDIEAREYETEELEARDFEEEEIEARAPASTSQNPLPANDSPSKTVTITVTPTPTPCTKKEIKTQKEQKKVNKALAVLRSAKGKKDLSRNDKQQTKRARKYLRRVSSRRARAAKRTAKKCHTALRNADLSSRKCKAGDNCDSGKVISSAKCKVASKYLQRVRTSKNLNKSKKNSKATRKPGKVLGASKTTVGSDNIMTVTVNAGPTCTSGSSSSKLRKNLITRDIVDEEFDSVFAREYDDLD